MSGFRKIISVLLAIGFMATSGNAQARCTLATVAGTQKAIPNSRLDTALLDAAILVLINYERCRKGRSELTTMPGLQREAAKHSGWMAQANTLTHKSTVNGRRSVQDRVRKSGVRFRRGSENIAMLHLYQVDGLSFRINSQQACSFSTNSGTPLPRHSYQSLAKSVVSYWMASASHRKNIMEKRITMIGSSAAVNTRGEYCGTVFLTQIFAG